MKLNNVAYLGALIVNVVLSCPVHADQLKLPSELGRVEGPRDLNLFQIEPTIINERYYTSGKCERHQFVGNVLPAGAEVPDTDWPVAVNVSPTHH